MNLDLPPKRELPPATRARLRATLHAGMNPATKPRIARYRGPVAVAAAAAVLVSGVVVLSKSMNATNDSTTTAATRTAPPTETPESARPPTPPPLDLAKSNAELDRCWAAVQRDGKATQFPDRSQWTPVFTVSFLSTTATAARVAGKAMFCETTPNTVTVTDPNATPSMAAGSRTGSLLISPYGTIAGVSDPSWRNVEVSVSRETRMGGEAWHKDGMFVFLSGISTRQGTSFAAGPGVSQPHGAPVALEAMTRPAPAAVSVVDRPSGPPADRNSEMGKALGHCIEQANNIVYEADSWEPGAMVSSGDDKIIMARNSVGVAGCSQDGDFSQFVDQVDGTRAAGAGKKPVPLPVNPYLGDRLAIAGAVPPDGTRLQILLGNGDIVEADVANSTFAALLPASAKSDGPGSVIKDKDRMTVRLYDSNNEVLYEGGL